MLDMVCMEIILKMEDCGRRELFMCRVIIYSGTYSTSTQITEEPHMTGGVSDSCAQMHTYKLLAVFFPYTHGFMLLPHISILRKLYLNMYTCALHCIHVLIWIFSTTFFLSTACDVRINWHCASGWPINIQIIISCQFRYIAIKWRHQYFVFYIPLFEEIITGKTENLWDARKVWDLWWVLFYHPMMLWQKKQCDRNIKVTERSSNFYCKPHCC